VIGRRAEQAEIRRRLLGEDRLVSVTGLSGAGKTTLVRAVAGELERSFPDGLVVVDLDGGGARRVPDAADLPADRPAAPPGDPLGASEARWVEEVLVGAVRGPVGGRRRPEPGALEEALGGRRVLLVLDGCDGLEQPLARLLGRVLAASPGLRVLATCRQPLRVTGEAVVPLGPLALPEPAAVGDPAMLADVESVQLFVERATRRLPSFRLTEDNAEAVAGICVALDGLPLAIALAAGRVLALSPHEIRERLGDRFRLLGRGDPEGPPRHQGLRAAVEATYASCPEQEQALWRRLTVFAGSFELTAVETVCAGEGIESHDVLDLVDSLLERSVLDREEAGPRAVRYRLPQSLAAFALERLSREERERWRGRHLAWCADLVGSSYRGWVGPRQADLVARVRAEHPNLRAALEHALDRPELLSTAVRMVVALEPVWWVGGRLGEARLWADRVLAGPAEAMSGQQRAEVLRLAAWFAVLQGDTRRGEELLAQVAGPELLETSRWLLVRAALAARRGRPDETEALLGRSVVRAQVDGDVAVEATAWLLRALARALLGDSRSAAEAAGECILLAERGGEGHLRSQALAVRALSALDDGDPDSAALVGAEAVRLAARLDDRFATTVVLEVLVWVAAARGEAERAAVLLGAADRGWRELRLPAERLPLVAARRRSVTATLHRALGAAETRRCQERGASWDRATASRFAAGEDVQPQPREPESPLSPREREVAALLARGLSNREIAKELVISPRTAQGHVENILRKLDFSSRTQVAAWMAQRIARSTAGA
jgi:predicted ATPase/DNA-binding CsgD family transcriptional regulator